MQWEKLTVHEILKYIILIPSFLPLSGGFRSSNQAVAFLISFLTHKVSIF